MNAFARRLAACAVFLCTPSFAAVKTTNETAVKALVQDFLRAEQSYDAAALARIIDPRYVEVSPAGEVDEHDRFLGFYAEDKRAPWPPMTTGDEQVRIFGDTAMEVIKFTYNIPGADGVSHVREIRGSFVAQKGKSGWKLLGAHYTGIRQPAAQ